MEVNEAIEYLNEIMEEQFDEFGYHEIATEGVRDLLKILVAENKAYKGMWKTLKKIVSDLGHYDLSVDCYHEEYGHTSIGVNMDNLEQKYLGGSK